MAESLKDRVVVVIGASSGIGRQTAILFAREGARVMASARREDRLRDLAMELATAGCPIEIHPADVTKAADMDELARATREKLGEIDALVFVTGDNTPDRSLKRLTPAIWDAMVSVNLNGAYYATQAVLPAMRERGSGHLIYVSSVSALAADPSGAAYQAAKRGVLGLAHAVRFEEKENGIRTSVVCPGLVETEILVKRPIKPTPELLAKALQPIDVAEAILGVAKMPQRATVMELHLWPTLL
ncbi:MAG TPA: SDR family oxidoreductase [Bryobacteraceae bacterium]|jgi:NADP-dependent 3-hydroxy acid dehydrogenase YdfG